MKRYLAFPIMLPHPVICIWSCSPDLDARTDISSTLFKKRLYLLCNTHSVTGITTSIQTLLTHLGYVLSVKKIHQQFPESSAGGEKRQLLRVVCIGGEADLCYSRKHHT